MQYDTKLTGTLTKEEKEQVLDLIHYFHDKGYTLDTALRTMNEAGLTMRRAASAEKV